MRSVPVVDVLRTLFVVSPCLMVSLYDPSGTVAGSAVLIILMSAQERLESLSCPPLGGNI